MHYKTSESTSVSHTQTIHGGNGKIKRIPLFDDVSRLPIKFEIWELAAGVSEGVHTHEGKFALEEIYYFLQGEGVVWADGEEEPVKAGDAILAPEGSDHGFRNTGRGPLKLVILWGRPCDAAT